MKYKIMDIRKNRIPYTSEYEGFAVKIADQFGQQFTVLVGEVSLEIIAKAVKDFLDDPTGGSLIGTIIEI